MKITINVSDQDVALLKRWASVSRTIETARRLLGELHDTTDDDSIQETAIHCEGELIELQPVLDRLHRTVREELWQCSK